MNRRQIVFRGEPGEVPGFRIVLRGAHASDWAAANPVPLDGEIIVVHGRRDDFVKIGDGVTPYLDLDFASKDEVFALIRGAGR